MQLRVQQRAATSIGARQHKYIVRVDVVDDDDTT
jgi:hypothetical protein